MQRAGLSPRWLIIPTVLFAFLSRQIVPIVIAGAAAIGLWAAKSWSIPPTAPPLLQSLKPFQPFAPVLQLAVVFVLLGGSVVVLLVLGIAVAAVVRYRRRVVAALEPWWQLQGAVPPPLRKLLAFVIPAIVGYHFGVRAGGREWTYTLVSVSLGAAIAFLLLFTPPKSLREGTEA